MVQHVAETENSNQKQVVVIGAGVIGICTAYFLAAAGHEVAVIERRGNVAEEASFGNAGVIAAAASGPLAMPGMPKKILSFLLRPEAPVLLHPHASRALWHWARQWMSECELERYLRNKTRMQRVALYSQGILHDMAQQHQLDYEKTTGLMQLFRTEKELAMSAPARTLLAENNVRHRLLDAAAAREIEPALASATALAGALYLPNDEAGNCPLFVKQLRQILQAAGVRFHFGSTVEALVPDGSRIALRVGDDTLRADAVVLAAGADSTNLLRPLGIDIPIYPVRGYSLTLPIKDFDAAPQAALVDETYKVAVTRIGARVRIAGMAELGRHKPKASERALQTLFKVGNDWFPGAAHYRSGTLWQGVSPMLPDGAPLLGRTPIKNLFINIGHGTDGWAMAAGSGKIVADLISQRTPEIDLDGLTLARYG